MFRNSAWYRQKAKEARAASSKSKNAEHAKFLNELADEWDKLAAVFEELERPKPSHNRRRRPRR